MAPDLINLEPALTELKCRISSSNSRRSFCSKCGATVLYQCDARPEVFDIAVGIVRSETGSLAKGWLEWDGAKVSRNDSVLDGELPVALMA